VSESNPEEKQVLEDSPKQNQTNVGEQSAQLLNIMKSFTEKVANPAEDLLLNAGSTTSGDFGKALSITIPVCMKCLMQKCPGTC
jgi:hypothetical protein